MMRLLVTFLGILLVMTVDARGDCGHMWDGMACHFSCPSGYEDAIGDHMCAEHGVGCPSFDGGGHQPSAPTTDNEDKRRLEQERREAEERRRQEEERHRQEAFMQARDEAVQLLKGVSAGGVGLKDAHTNTPVFGLKGVDFADSTIKAIGPERHPRDLAGPNAAWKQLHCSASIFGYGIAAAKRATNQADLEEVKYLGDEALSALTGNPIGVECPPVPPLDNPKELSFAPTSPLVRLYTGLVIATTKQTELLIQSKQERTQVETQVHETKQKVEQLKVELAKEPPGSDKPKESAMAEAQAALAAALEAEAEAKADEAKATQRLEQYEKLNKRAKDNPDNAADLYAELMKGG